MKRQHFLMLLLLFPFVTIMAQNDHTISHWHLGTYETGGAISPHNLKKMDFIRCGFDPNSCDSYSSFIYEENFFISSGLKVEHRFFKDRCLFSFGIHYRYMRNALYCDYSTDYMLINISENTDYDNYLSIDDIYQSLHYIGSQVNLKVYLFSMEEKWNLYFNAGFDINYLTKENFKINFHNNMDAYYDNVKNLWGNPSTMYGVTNITFGVTFGHISKVHASAEVGPGIRSFGTISSFSESSGCFLYGEANLFFPLNF